IPLYLPPPLLRFLPDPSFSLLFSTQLLPTALLLISAPNRYLKKMVSSLDFRSYLYSRLNFFPIFLPPLRERPYSLPPFSYPPLPLPTNS
ncbi:sigma 54-interacting transcriptional regulator, partial [Enterobacter quasiroggenkampii]|uniref:sigma 54-interacting transcriptional regulator n=1 Tax=Enterobacter quasiroggenkampii TaxID=2497436 RepID=UPI0021D06F3F